MRHLHTLLACAAQRALRLVAACSKDKVIDAAGEAHRRSQPTLRVQHVWSATVDDKKAADLRLGLGLAAEGDRVYAPATRATWRPSTCRTARRLWRTNLKAPLVRRHRRVRGDLVLIGSSNGRLFALDAADGKTRWHAQVNGEVLAPGGHLRETRSRCAPSTASCAACRRGRPRAVAAEQQVPRLSLRGTARRCMSGDVVLCGFDNGKVAGRERAATARCSGRRP